MWAKGTWSSNWCEHQLGNVLSHSLKVPSGMKLMTVDSQTTNFLLLMLLKTIICTYVYKVNGKYRLFTEV